VNAGQGTSGKGDALRTSGAAVDASFSGQPATSPGAKCELLTWVDFCLQNASGEPIANMRYVLTDSDGKTSEGVTDLDGCAGKDDLHPGKCSIKYLGLVENAVTGPAEGGTVPKETPPTKALKKQTILWNAPKPIAYPATLKEQHFRATCSGNAKLVYDHAPGDILAPSKPGEPWKLKVQASETAVYAAETAEVELTVNKGKQTIEWVPEGAQTIPYGTSVQTLLRKVGAQVREKDGGAIGYESPAGTGLDVNKIPDCPNIKITPKAAGNDLYEPTVGPLLPVKVEPIGFTITWAPTGPFTHQQQLGDIFHAVYEPMLPGADVTYKYKANVDTKLNGGDEELWVTVKPPRGNKNYKTTKLEVMITVGPGKQTIVWETIEPFVYGKKALDADLKKAKNRTADGGAITYRIKRRGGNPEPFISGSVLDAGEYQMVAIAAPKSPYYMETEAESSVFKVDQSPQTIGWSPTRCEIPIGGQLSADQRTAAVVENPAAEITYTPKAKTGMKVGRGNFVVEVSAKGSANFKPAKPVVFKLEVVRKERTLVWKRALGTIAYGDKLTFQQGDVTVEPVANVTFSGAESLQPGENLIWANVAADGIFNSAIARAKLIVKDFPQEIAWTPATIPYGEKLGGDQLNAAIVKGNTDAVPVYIPAAGVYPNAGPAAPNAGTQCLVKVTIGAGKFYKAGEKTVNVLVVPAKPEITWAVPEAILEGDATAFPRPSFMPGKGEGVSPGCWMTTTQNGSKLHAGAKTVTVKSQATNNFTEGICSRSIVVIPEDHISSISKGHAWGKHVLGTDHDGRCDWLDATGGLALVNKEAFAAEIKSVMTSAISQARGAATAASKNVKVVDGTVYFWDSGRVVCYDPSSHDKGTCFKPDGFRAGQDQGRYYYANKK